MQLPVRTRAQNREFLLARFVARLLDQAPASILDVGCGRGDLLRRAADAGIQVSGLDRESETLAALASSGLDVHAGRAEALPFEARSFDWVTLRHVPHHLEDPARALAEAVRVARTGVLVAEPWYDRSIPSQAVGHEFEQWLRARDRARGEVHGPGFEPAELAAMLLTASPDLEITLETHLRPAVMGAEDVAEHRAADPGPEVAELFARAERVGLGLGGSALAIARRAP
jgi:SAM-dependent methyltransferase